MAKKNTGGETPQDLFHTLKEALAPELKALGGASYILSEDMDAPNEPQAWVSSGIDLLDIAISNKLGVGAYPVGRIIEIMGLESTGKSILVAAALLDVQRRGGIPVMIDSEVALSREFYTAMGFDWDNFLYIPLNGLESAFSIVEKIIAHVRQKDANRLVAIGIDSLTALSPETELAGDGKTQGYGTTKAKIMSLELRRLTQYFGNERVCLLVTNQLRESLGGTFGTTYTTSGGMALRFYASVRISLKVLEKLKGKRGGVDKIIGVRVKADIVKNKVGPAYKSVVFDIYYDHGVDNWGTLFYALKQYKEIGQSGAWYTFKQVDPDTGEVLQEIKFQEKDFYQKVIQEAGLHDYILSILKDKYIMEYKKPGELGAVDED